MKPNINLKPLNLFRAIAFRDEYSRKDISIPQEIELAFQSGLADYLGRCISQSFNFTNENIDSIICTTKISEELNHLEKPYES